jgi:hypothetical protein
MVPLDLKPPKEQMAGQYPAGQKKSIGFVYFNQPQNNPIVLKKWLQRFQIGVNRF